MEEFVQWLGAQLDEDERIARKATSRESGGARWEFVDMHVRAGDGAPVTRHTWVDEGAHIAEWDPTRVLREIDAKRQIIEQHERYAAERRRMMGGWDPQSDDSPILAALATVYADRPGFRPEWAAVVT